MFKRLFKRLIGRPTEREEYSKLFWEPLGRVENARIAADVDVFADDLMADADGFWRVDVEVGDPCSAAVRLTNGGGSRLLWLNGGSPLVPVSYTHLTLPTKRIV